MGQRVNINRDIDMKDLVV